MKWSYVSAFVVGAGLIGLGILMLFQNLTTQNEQDYYLLKETTEAAMLDAVDVAYYRATGELKIVEEKFIENFTRRFAEVASLNSSGYTLEFYDIIEVPPKVSVKIKSGTDEYTFNGDAASFDIVNQLDAILETKY